jgi:hypothetical protein
MDVTRTEAAVVLFEADMYPTFAWRDSPCPGEFKTLDISDEKTAANFILLAAKFGNELRKKVTSLAVRNRGIVMDIYSSFFILVVKSVI